MGKRDRRVVVQARELEGRMRVSVCVDETERGRRERERSDSGIRREIEKSDGNGMIERERESGVKVERTREIDQ